MSTKKKITWAKAKKDLNKMVRAAELETKATMISKLTTDATIIVWIKDNLAHPPLTEDQKAYLSLDELRTVRRCLEQAYELSSQRLALMAAAVARHEKANS